MPRSIRGRLTYANVTATLALVFALGGGGAYATHELIRSSDIVDGEVKTPDIKDAGIFGVDVALNSINGARIADNTLKGVDVDESSLAKVPDADKLDGIDSGELPLAKRLDFRANAGASGSFTLGGLTLDFSCLANRDLQIFYSSAVNDASLRVAWSTFGVANAKTFVNDNVDSGVLSDLTTSEDFDDSAGTFVYTQPDGPSTVVDFQSEDSDMSGTPEALGGTKDCLMSGVGVMR